MGNAGSHQRLTEHWRAPLSPTTYPLLRDPRPAPDREPDRRRPELPRVPFLDPVPDAPGRFALFRAPVEPCPEVCPFRPRGASGFDPLPLADACDLGGRPALPVLTGVGRRVVREAVPRDRPPRPPPPPPMVWSAASPPRSASSCVSSGSDLSSRPAILRLRPFAPARLVPLHDGSHALDGTDQLRYLLPFAGMERRSTAASADASSAEWSRSCTTRCEPQYHRRVSTGSMRIARRVGPAVASSATAIRRATVAEYTHGSAG